MSVISQVVADALDRDRERIIELLKIEDVTFTSHWIARRVFALIRGEDVA